MPKPGITKKAAKKGLQQKSDTDSDDESNGGDESSPGPEDQASSVVFCYVWALT